MTLTLGQYARITQALAVAGIGEEEVFAAERISRDEWQALRAPLDEEIVAALEEEEHPLIASYEDAIRAARAHLTRPLAPLDNDATAWFGFLKAWADSSDPGFLGRQGLNPVDLQNLVALWAVRLSQMRPEERITALQAPAQVPSLNLPAPQYPSPPDPVGPVLCSALASQNNRPSRSPNAEAAEDDETADDDNEEAADVEEATASGRNNGDAPTAGGGGGAELPVFGPLRSRGRFG